MSSFDGAGIHRSRRSLRALSLLILLSLSIPITAGRTLAEQNFETAPREKVVIERVEIQGVSRTRPIVVTREFEFEVGVPTAPEEIEETMRRLRNLGLFASVDFALHPLETEDFEITPVVLELTLEERWTLLPITDFRRGGGVTQWKVGVRDINLVGRYLELGAEFERLDIVNSGAAWFRDPRLFGQRMAFGVEAGYRNRIYTLYDDAGDVEGGFLLRRLRLEFDLDREWKWWLRSGVALELSDETPSLDVITDEIRRTQPEEELPPDTRLLRPALTARLGRLDRENDRREGLAWNIEVGAAHQALFSSESFLTLQSELIFARNLPLRSILTMRFLTEATGAEAEHYQLFIGGLDHVCGFLENRFRGPYQWTANVEYRIPSLDTEWVVLQHAFFSDAASVGEGPGDLLGLNALSAGAGLRLTSPRVYRLVLRVDYAFSLYGDGGAPISIGGEQFF